MRVELDRYSWTATPGQPVDVVLHVYNSGSVIHGITAHILGLDRAWVSCQPAQLALFPDSSGDLTLRIQLPPEFAAGEHAVTVEVVSSVDPDEVVRVDAQLTVTPYTDAVIKVLPAVVSARRRGRFIVECHNTGNVPVDVALHATDPERALRFAFETASLAAGPGTIASTVCKVRATRHLFGAELTRLVTISASSPTVETQANATYRQRPAIARGLFTTAILAAIIALWAAAFLLGLSRVLSHDHLTKSAPASFFAPVSATQAAGGIGVAAAAGGPAGAVPKTGVAGGVSGTISGTVTALSTNQGVGRITVEAIRVTPAGSRLVSSAATQADGTYTVQGLFPDNYRLHFTAQGFKDVWYPAAPDETGAAPVNVTSATATKGMDATIQGLPGSITGKVDTGDTTGPVPVTIAVRQVQTTAAGAPPVTAATDGQGGFSVPNLPTPGIYEVTFSAPGYQLGTDVETLSGGQARLTNTIHLTAGLGTISGLVTDGQNPLGGVIVTTTEAGQTVTSATPTAGTIGRFALTGLPTPATYLVTFAKDQFGAQTIVVALGAGQTRNDLAVVLVGGTGTVSGKVVDPAGNPMGDVAVTVGGGPTAAATKTLTAGAIGSYLVSGLPTPADYTLTFSAPGFGDQTIAVSLTTNSLAKDVNVTMVPSVGRLVGSVTSDLPGALGLDGVAISVTNGSTVVTTASTSNPAGVYAMPGLPAGTYSVTFTIDGFESETALVTIAAGQDTKQDIVLHKQA